MVHIAPLAVGRFHSVDHLGVRQGSESHYIKGLSQPASEQARAVRPRQDGDLARQWTDFVEFTTIWTDRFFSDPCPHVFMNCHCKGFVVVGF